MSVSITHFVDVNVVLAGAAASVFNFGAPCGVFEHDITVNRFDGPYGTIEAVQAAGFTAADAPKVHAWASSVFNQSPKVDQLFIGRIDGSDADLTESLDAIEEEAGPAAWYITNVESRAEADILLAAAWTEARFKIYMAQSSDALVAQISTVTFTGTTDAGTYSIHVVDGEDVDVTISFVAGGSTTAAAVATALIAAWDADGGAAAIADASSGGSGIVTLTFLKKGVNYTITTVVVNGTGTPANTTPATGDIGSQLRKAGLKRTALWWHAADDHTDGTIAADGYLDGAVTSRCGAFELDSPAGRGTWHGKQLNGITPDEFSEPDADEWYEQQVNLYAEVSDLSFTSKGTMAGGSEANPRFIDVTVTLDWLKKRLEEQLLAFFVATPTVIPYTQAGISSTKTEAFKVFNRGVTYGHLSPDVVPKMTAPRITEVSSGAKLTRTLSMTGECTLAGGIHKVVLNVTVQQ